MIQGSYDRRTLTGVTVEARLPQLPLFQGPKASMTMMIMQMLRIMLTLIIMNDHDDNFKHADVEDNTDFDNHE